MYFSSSSSSSSSLRPVATSRGSTPGPKSYISSSILSPIRRRPRAARTTSHQFFVSHSLTLPFGLLLVLLTLSLSPRPSPLPVLVRCGFLFPRCEFFEGLKTATKPTGMVAPVRETAISTGVSQMMLLGSSPCSSSPSPPLSPRLARPPRSLSLSRSSFSLVPFFYKHSILRKTDHTFPFR